MKLRLAIIGAGWAGSRQTEAIRELNGDVDPVCIVDPDERAARDVADRFGVPDAHAEYRDALARHDIDAVSICTPHALHAEISIAAARAGKHVLCEKPIATSVAEGMAMRAAASENSVALFVAENEAYSDETFALQHVISQADTLGDLVFVRVCRGFRTKRFAYDGRRAWLARPDLGGTGTWTLHGVHTVAQIRAVLGEVESVFLSAYASPAFENSDVEGTVCGTLIMSSGIAVSITQTCENDLPGDTGGWTLYGNRGTVQAGNRGVREISKGGERPVTFAAPDLLSSYAREIAAFARYVRGTPASTDTTDATSELKSLAVVEAGYTPIQTGEAVSLRKRYPDLF